MKRTIFYFSLMHLFLLSNAFSNDLADEVFLDGSIHTFNQSLSIENSIAIKDGIILAVGTKSSIQKLIGENTKVNNLEGKMMLPSFHDAHSHPIWDGVNRLKCILTDLYDIQDIKDMLRVCLNSELTQTTGWIVGSGLNIGLFSAGNPNKSLLDDISKDIPIILWANDGHSALANSKAFELANITAETINPPYGVIERDPQTGEPSGTLRESSAINLVLVLTPKDTDSDYDKGLSISQEMAHSFGITSVLEAAVGERHMATYKRAADREELDLRVFTCLEYGKTNFVHDASTFEDVYLKLDQFNHPRINVNCVKIFIDGVLEGQTGALLEPYLDSGEIGELILEKESLNKAIARFDSENRQVHTHAIGDRAVRAALDAYEYALKENGSLDNRHHISHLQMISKEDIPRFSELNIAATFQAVWAMPDEYITGISIPEIGIERVNKMYPIQSVFEAGGLIVGGSDWAVTTMNPLIAIETAITRKDPEDRLKGTLNKDERMGLTEMLKAYTINAAYIMHQDNITGSIEAGKFADLIILDKNLYNITPNEISEVRVVATIIEGKTVFSIK
ncbi:MAG: amidohydrolase [Gammaproteobacteria bacterium]|nr:amidohydrolase [Gammaproteobacteria bacterium]